MKNTIFIKVSTAEELPEKGGICYITDLGEVLYSVSDKSFLSRWGQGPINCRWWLKEVELPSAEELRKASLGKFTEKDAADEEIGDFVEDDAKEFMKGVNYILNKLK